LKGDSSQASQNLSALKYFGLVEYVGATDDRKVMLTDDARNYLRAQQASMKQEIARSCALRPKAMQIYWERWGPDRPIDEICLDQLILKDSFTESAAKVFLRVYDDTIAFAGLSQSSRDESISEPDEEEDKESIEVQQQLPSPEPALRRHAVHGGIPPKGPGMRQEVFALAEGDVVIQWPEPISADSFQDFSDWLKILERKIRRSVTSSAQGKQSDDQSEPNTDI